MNMPRLLVFALVVLGSVPAARAQSVSASTAVPKDKDAVVFNEIERGFFIGLQLGPSFFLNAPQPDGKGPFSSGQQAMVELGFDIGDHVAVSLFAIASMNRAGANYAGYSLANTPVTGDFTSFVPGVSIRAKIVGFDDPQQVRRTWIYVRAGGGYALFTPQQLLPNPDILVFLGPGIEYYTRLRHFSIGVEVVGSVLLNSKAIGFAVTPNLRYAF